MLRKYHVSLTVIVSCACVFFVVVHQSITYFTIDGVYEIQYCSHCSEEETEAEGD